MSEYFKNIPRVLYDTHGEDVRARNLVLRAGLAREVIERYEVFYPYRVKDWERCDTIAFDYYGDSKYDWLIYFANDILDPYVDWPLPDWEFLEFIKDKYGSLEYAQATVHHWENEDPAITYWMSPETRLNLAPEDRLGFDVEWTIWEWEYERNERKKSIRLLSRAYAPQALYELKSVFGNDRA